MSKRRDPVPHSVSLPILAARFGCVLILIGLVVAYYWGPHWNMIGVIGLAIWGNWLKKWLTLRRTRHSFKARGLVGLLITSDSPKWCTYIEENWIPQLGDRVATVKLSGKSRLGDRTDVRFSKVFGSSEYSYCPVLILLPAHDTPMVFQFFYAFRDYKHGNDAALKHREKQMFAEFAKLLLEA